MNSEQVAEVAGITATTIANWIQRGKILTNLAPTARGKWRVFSEENAKEIIGLAAARRHGIELDKARDICCSHCGENPFGLDKQ